MEELAAKQVLLDFEIILLIALFAGVGFFALSRRLSKRARPGPGDFDGYDIALMLFPALLFLFNPLLELAVARSTHGNEEPAADPGIQGIIVNILYFTFVGVMTYGIIEWIRNRRVVDLFGLKRLSLPIVVVCSIVGGVASIVLCGWILGNASEEFLDGIFVELRKQEAVEHIRESSSTVHFVLSVAMACVAAPVVEELLFRGYMYGAVKQATNSLFASVVVGGLFAVVHGNLPALVPLWAFSFLLCLAYEWTRCLWVPVGMHAFFNAANIVLMQIPEAVE
jgi:membrane protease YdiL (CAAX protease family)